jgi:predicted SnoaL-like aldol condensation-catalyzing enzyme
MSIDRFPVGMEIEITFPHFKVTQTFLSASDLKFEIKEGPYARTELVDLQVMPLGNSKYALSWKESDGATVTNIQDHDLGIVSSFATLPDGQFLRMSGTIVVVKPSDQIFDDRPERNKKLVLEAMTSLFQRHDASVVKRLYTPDYIQHNPAIPQGRDALKGLVASLSSDVFYEPGLMIAEGNYVAIHGRIRGWAETPQVVVDLFRIENGQLAEHWDVLQNEIPASAAAGRIAMFDPSERSLIASQEIL